MSQLSTLAPDLKESLETCYGNNRFKCPRHACFYFHEGFATARHRDQHVIRHERPFCCSHDGCSRMQTGFSNENELNVHLRRSHPDPESLSWKFPKPSVLKNADIKRDSTVQCYLCPKRFTRPSILKSHLRTHTSERPFSCTVCGKSFLRKSDVTRHIPVHSGEKKFECRGDLKHGGQWGCGRRFPRVDALNRHLRSESGMACMKSLREEEFSEQLRDEAVQPEALVTSVDTRYAFWNGKLPAALIAQYPTLATLEALDFEGDGFEHDSFLNDAFPLGPHGFLEDTMHS